MRNLTIAEMIYSDDCVIVVNNIEERDSFLARFEKEGRGWDEGGGGSAYRHDKFPIYLAIDMFGCRGVYSPDAFKMIPNRFGPGVFKYVNWNDVKDTMVPDDYDAKAVYQSDPEYQRRKAEYEAEEKARLEEADDDDDDEDYREGRHDRYYYDDDDDYDDQDDDEEE